MAMPNELGNVHKMHKKGPKSTKIRFFLCLLSFGLFGVWPGFAQSDLGVEVTLVAEDARSTFRLGESMTLELHYSAKAAGQYEVHPSSARQLYYSPIRAIVEPSL